MTKEKENLQFRYLYGLAILFVVFSHCDGGGVQMLSNWMHFGAFHLAIFVFGSGYFFNDKKIEHPMGYLWHKIKTLLLPLWCWNLFYGLVVMMLRVFGFTFADALTWKGLVLGPVINPDLYRLNMGSWFVFPFFMVQMIYGLLKYVLDRLGKPAVTDVILQVAFLVAGVCGVQYAGNGLHEVWQFVALRILYFMPFYVLGIRYGKHAESGLKKVPAAGILIGCLLAALLLNTYFGRVVYAIPSSCDYPFGTLATYASALIGILFWLTVSRILAKHCEQIGILATLGRSTWDIMIHQFAGMMLVKFVFAGANCLFGIFTDFDWNVFYGDIWYMYRPKGIGEYALLYVVGAIGFSIFVKWLMQQVKHKWLLRNQVKAE